MWYDLVKTHNMSPTALGFNAFKNDFSKQLTALIIFPNDAKLAWVQPIRLNCFSAFLTIRFVASHNACTISSFLGTHNGGIGYERCSVKQVFENSCKTSSKNNCNKVWFKKNCGFLMKTFLQLSRIEIFSSRWLLLACFT